MPTAASATAMAAMSEREPTTTDARTAADDRVDDAARQHGVATASTGADAR